MLLRADMLRNQVLLFVLAVGLRALETQASGRGIRHLYQPPLITALVGDTRTVNCTFECAESERAFGKWERMTSNQSVDRISLICTALMSACTVTMEIKNLTLQHTDTYFCAVKPPDAAAETTGNGTRIIVYEKVVSVEEVVVGGEELELNCSATGFYPEEIAFTWTRGALHSAVQNNRVNHADGTFSAYSRLRFTPDPADNGATVGCHINHSSLSETLTRLTTLNVTYSPRSFNVTYSIDSKTPQPVEKAGIYAPEMSTLRLHCAFQSNPQSSVSWLIERNSAADFKSAHLVIDGVRVEDEGTYWCMANNSNGAGNSSVAVRVKPRVPSLPFIFIVVLTSLTVLVIIVTMVSSKSQDKRNPKEKQEVVFSEVRFVMGTPQPKAHCQLPTKDLGSGGSSRMNTVCPLVSLSSGPDRE
ncbi:cell adhesion molecule 1-like isoform X2 [Polyodon spathula]|uniref:cell adhesion molecule 1-like isoform X2 n=1 Tax=Polyodon spathula TaxID=7913 RepID=UPI001B7F1A5D|nr:cell adhesion molecule 1-like isoform X2 [Polyodon spathula]